MTFTLPIKIEQPTRFERWLTRIGVCAYCRTSSLQLKLRAQRMNSERSSNR